MTMVSWWELGLVRRHTGEELSPVVLRCPYCSSQGRFDRVFRAENNISNLKHHHYADVYRCQACDNHNYALWSEEKGVVNYQIYPQDTHRHEVIDNWPEAVTIDYHAALKSLFDDEFDAVVVMSRRIIDKVALHFGIISKGLDLVLDEMRQHGLITQAVADWGKEIIVVTPAVIAGKPLSIEDQAHEALRFTRMLLDQSLTIPNVISLYKQKDMGKTV
ncbi:DUF4145 domain-containing protein [Pseudomonadota bacterium]